MDVRTKVVNLRKSPYTVYIGRGSKWGNPYKIGRSGDRETVLQKYYAYLMGNPELLDALVELRGETLGCYCAPLPCHGDILADLANNLDKRP